MKKLQLILGDQLFETNVNLQAEAFVIIESLTEAKRLHYHNYRLAFMFSAMRHHADLLTESGKKVLYFSLAQNQNFESVLNNLSKEFDILSYLPTNDLWFEKELLNWGKNFTKVEKTRAENNSFLTSKEDFALWLKGNGSRKLKMANFYIWQRQRLNILIDENKKPIGGNWSYDTVNRKKLPKSVEIPDRIFEYKSDHFTQVSAELEKFVPLTTGKSLEISWLPLTNADAKKHLFEFCQTCLTNFGPYEDALSTRNPYLFHSTISPLINCGLLTPKEIITQVIKSFNESKQKHLPSLEGFIRQIIGWREWVNCIYHTEYTKPFSQYNFFNHTKPLPNYFYYPETAPLEIKENIPLYHTLLTVHNLAWCHHIPRLMILSNWMVLNEYNPIECYEWFSSQFVDAAEWVMVANVFGMGLFADGGKFATKPYISGGNYIKRMSDFEHPEKWEKTWTNLYWKFIEKHSKFFCTNPRMAMIIKGRLGREEVI